MVFFEDVLVFRMALVQIYRMPLQFGPIFPRSIDLLERRQLRDFLDAS